MSVQVAMLMGDNADRMANALELIAEAQASNITEITDFYKIDRIVKSGMGSHFFPVGTQISTTWKESDAGTEYTNPWDVVHHYSNGDMALNMHFAYPTGVPFDQPEAIYYAPDGGLAAGQYYITIGLAYGSGWVVGEHINFTLTSAMDAGDQLVLSTATNNANNPTNGMAWNVYAKGSTTSKENGVTSNSSEGTELGSTSTSGTGYTNGQINAPQRIVYGYNRWSQSAVRQWLNSAATANAWWTAQNGWDRPPAVAETLRGFLAGFSTDFVDILQPYPVVTALNTVEGATETTETTYDRIFLPSKTEYYQSAQYTEGEQWDYFKTLAQQAGYTGVFPNSTNIAVLKKYNLSAQTSAVYVWERSAARGNATNVWNVNSNGAVGNSNAACNADRGCPACIIRKSA